MKQNKARARLPTAMESYMKRLELDGDCIKRAREAYFVCAELCPDSLKDMFLDTTLGKNKKVRYSDVTFFSQRYFVSASDFMTERREYIVNFIHRVGHGYRLIATNYNFPKATDKSNVYVDFLAAGVSSDQARWFFNAAGKNCDELVTLMLKYMKPNLRNR